MFDRAHQTQSTNASIAQTHSVDSTAEPDARHRKLSRNVMFDAPSSALHSALDEPAFDSEDRKTSTKVSAPDTAPAKAEEGSDARENDTNQYITRPTVSKQSKTKSERRDSNPTECLHLGVLSTRALNHCERYSVVTACTLQAEIPAHTKYDALSCEESYLNQKASRKMFLREFDERRHDPSSCHEPNNEGSQKAPCTSSTQLTTTHPKRCGQANEAEPGVDDGTNTHDNKKQSNRFNPQRSVFKQSPPLEENNIRYTSSKRPSEFHLAAWCQGNSTPPREGHNAKRARYESSKSMKKDRHRLQLVHNTQIVSSPIVTTKTTTINACKNNALDVLTKTATTANNTSVAQVPHCINGSKKCAIAPNEDSPSQTRHDGRYGSAPYFSPASFSSLSSASPAKRYRPSQQPRQPRSIFTTSYPRGSALDSAYQSYTRERGGQVDHYFLDLRQMGKQQQHYVGHYGPQQNSSYRHPTPHEFQHFPKQQCIPPPPPPHPSYYPPMTTRSQYAVPSPYLSCPRTPSYPIQYPTQYAPSKMGHTQVTAGPTLASHHSEEQQERHPHNHEQIIGWKRYQNQRDGCIADENQISIAINKEVATPSDLSSLSSSFKVETDPSRSSVDAPITWPLDSTCHASSPIKIHTDSGTPTTTKGIQTFLTALRGCDNDESDGNIMCAFSGHRREHSEPLAFPRNKRASDDVPGRGRGFRHGGLQRESSFSSSSTFVGPVGPGLFHNFQHHRDDDGERFAIAAANDDDTDSPAKVNAFRGAPAVSSSVASESLDASRGATRAEEEEKVAGGSLLLCQDSADTPRYRPPRAFVPSKRAASAGHCDPGKRRDDDDDGERLAAEAAVVPARACVSAPPAAAPRHYMVTQTSKRYRRKCSVPSCPNRVVQGGLCISHGAKRKRCGHPGCTKHVKKAGRCSAHGPTRKRCNFEGGCDKAAVQGGRCIAHGAKKRLCRARTNDGAGCTKQAVLLGMCKRHHDEHCGEREGGGIDDVGGGGAQPPPPPLPPPSLSQHGLPLCLAVEAAAGGPAVSGGRRGPEASTSPRAPRQPDATRATSQRRRHPLSIFQDMNAVDTIIGEDVGRFNGSGGVPMSPPW